MLALVCFSFVSNNVECLFMCFLAISISLCSVIRKNKLLMQFVCNMSLQLTCNDRNKSENTSSERGQPSKCDSICMKFCNRRGYDEHENMTLCSVYQVFCPLVLN